MSGEHPRLRLPPPGRHYPGDAFDLGRELSRAHECLCTFAKKITDRDRAQFAYELRETARLIEEMPPVYQNPAAKRNLIGRAITLMEREASDPHIASALQHLNAALAAEEAKS